MKHTISPEGYEIWYFLWLEDTTQHMGKHFCNYFKIDDNILETSEDIVFVCRTINAYLLSGWV